MTREEPVAELLIDIRDFTTQFYVILRRQSSEWLESSMQSNLGVRFAIRSLDLAIPELYYLLSSNSISSLRTGY